MRLLWLPLSLPSLGTDGMAKTCERAFSFEVLLPLFTYIEFALSGLCFEQDCVRCSVIPNMPSFLL